VQLTLEDISYGHGQDVNIAQVKDECYSILGTLVAVTTFLLK